MHLQTNDRSMLEFVCSNRDKKRANDHVKGMNLERVVLVLSSVDMDIDVGAGPST